MVSKMYFDCCPKCKAGLVIDVYDDEFEEIEKSKAFLTDNNNRVVLSLRWSEQKRVR